MLIFKINFFMPLWTPPPKKKKNTKKTASQNPKSEIKKLTNNENICAEHHYTRFLFVRINIISTAKLRFGWDFWLTFKGTGGGDPGSKIFFSLVLRYFIIWNIWDQELFTESKKLDPLSRYDVSKLGPMRFEEFRQICMENLEISFGFL